MDDYSEEESDREGKEEDSGTYHGGGVGGTRIAGGKEESLDDYSEEESDREGEEEDSGTYHKGGVGG